jgi:hypothetical protein
MRQFMPEPVAQPSLDLLGAPSAPFEQQVSPDVECVLGRAPCSFAARARLPVIRSR